MDFERCSEDSRHPWLVVAENRRVFRIRNPTNQTIKKLRVDGCLIEDERIRCDYAFEVGARCHCVVYLELKGSDIEHAVAQLVATLGYLAKRHQSKRKICHIVASRVPRAGPKIQILKLEMNRAHQAALYVGTQEVTIDVRDEPYCKP